MSEIQPKSYQQLLSLKGVGAKTIRALALTAEVIYGAKASYEDPARYSFAHGGKNAVPYPVDRPTYDQTIATMRSLASKMKIGYSEKNKVIREAEINMPKIEENQPRSRKPVRATKLLSK